MQIIELRGENNENITEKETIVEERPTKRFKAYKTPVGNNDGFVLPGPPLEHQVNL